MKNKIAAALLCLLFSVQGTGCGQKKPETPPDLLTEFPMECLSERAEGKKAKVVLLYGQSNATGISDCSFLKEKVPEEYREITETIGRVRINFITENGGNSSHGKWIPCSFDCGAGAGRFGPEVGIARKYAALYPDGDVFIIKYTYNGTTLHDQWLDGDGGRGYLYNAGMAFTKAALKTLTDAGYDVKIDGICWMQGENDSIFDHYTRAYQRNTEKLIGYFRKDLKDYQKAIPFIDAGIADVTYWKNYAQINRAKQKAAQKSPDNRYIDTIPMNLTTDKEPPETPDLAHYDAESMLRLGECFGEYLTGGK